MLIIINIVSSITQCPRSVGALSVYDDTFRFSDSLTNDIDSDTKAANRRRGEKMT